MFRTLRFPDGSVLFDSSSSVAFSVGGYSFHPISPRSVAFRRTRGMVPWMTRDPFFVWLAGVSRRSMIQSSANRFWMLPFLCHRWRGPISIAVLEEESEVSPEGRTGEPGAESLSLSPGVVEIHAWPKLEGKRVGEHSASSMITMRLLVDEDSNSSWNSRGPGVMG